MVKLLSEDAPAKINLYLRVTGRRPDGYHELDSIFVPIALCDRVRIELRPNATRSVTLRCDSNDLPVDGRNIAYRAAVDFLAAFAVDGQVLIDLNKRIPVGAGLGGGSSGAAAVLRMLATMCRISDAPRLAALALALGADVPFFLQPRPARVGGIGERIAPLDRFPHLHLVLVVPPFEVSTAEVFRLLEPRHWSGPASAEKLRKILQQEFEADLLVNDLAAVATTKWPAIGRLIALLNDAGASAAAMTGSGSAVFGLFPTADSATRAAHQLGERAPEARVFSVGSYQPAQ
jgi:4-diphosphocytidyl-2-C-methyl-D-erythritol kinase